MESSPFRELLSESGIIILAVVITFIESFLGSSTVLLFVLARLTEPFYAIDATFIHALHATSKRGAVKCPRPHSQYLAELGVPHSQVSLQGRC